MKQRNKELNNIPTEAENIPERCSQAGQALILPKDYTNIFDAI